MDRRISRRSFFKVTGLGLAGAAFLGPAGCGTEVGGGGGNQANGGQTSAQHLVESKEGPYVVGLSNSFVGNSWRTQMVAELRYAVQQRQDQVKDLIVANANNDVSTQNSQIGNLASQGVDLLLVDAASQTALNGAIQRAHDQGVLVVSFDNIVTSPYAMKVNPSQEEFGRVGATYLVQEMGGDGSVFGLNGVAGSPVNEARWSAARNTLKEAGIEIVGQANADWDQAQGRQAASNLLAAHPNVTGIYSQGGAMTLGALQALGAASKDLLPIPGEGYNGFLKRWQELKQSRGWTSVAPAQPPSLSVTALDYGLRAIDGEQVPAEPKVKLPVINQDNLKEYVRPDFPDSLWLPTELPDKELQKLF